MKNMEETNKTIGYYNSNAVQYFSDTVNIDMSECCDRFLKYVVPGGRIIDIGAGSGRDIKFFKDRGYVVEGIDASKEMCQLATNYSGIEVVCERIQDWKPQKKYDGIWASASLLHLSINEIEDFICRVPKYLTQKGVPCLSLKKCEKTWRDINGRFFARISEGKLNQMVTNSNALRVLELWETHDEMCRDEVRWINAILALGCTVKNA